MTTNGRENTNHSKMGTLTHMSTLLHLQSGDHQQHNNCPVKLFETNELFLPSLSMHRAQQPDGQMPPGKLATNKHGTSTN